MKSYLLALGLLLASISASAANVGDPYHGKLSKEFYNTLNKIMPNVPPSGIFTSQIDGMLQVVYGPRLMYISTDGRYLFYGNIVDMDTKTNVTRAVQDNLRNLMINRSFNTKDMVVFTPPHYKSTITVFSDVDCPYCRKLHSEITSYLNKGIRVRYLLYPRAGMGSSSANKSLDVMCANNKKQALTAAMSDMPFQFNASCVSKMQNTDNNPVNRSFVLGQMIGIRATPTIVLDNGSMISEYVPADQLSKLLDKLHSKHLTAMNDEGKTE